MAADSDEFSDYWKKVGNSEIYRSFVDPEQDHAYWNVGTTLIKQTDQLIFIDMGIGARWDLLLEELKSNENIANINTIHVLFTHYHHDHCSGLSNFIRFIDDVVWNNKPIVLFYLFQQIDDIDGMVQNDYYSKDYFEKYLDKMEKQNQLPPVTETVRMHTLNPRARNKVIQTEIFQNLVKRGIKKLNDIPDTYISLQPIRIVTEEGYLHEPINVYALPLNKSDDIRVRNRFKEAMLDFSTSSEYRTQRFQEKYPPLKTTLENITIHIFSDQAHSPDHIFMRLEYHSEQKSNIIWHFGDIFPLKFALNDADYSKHGNLSGRLRFIKINALSESDKKIPFIISHCCSVGNESGNNTFEDLNAVFTPEVEDLLKIIESLIELPQNQEQVITYLEKEIATRFVFQTIYMVKHHGELSVFQKRLRSILLEPIN